MHKNFRLLIAVLSKLRLNRFPLVNGSIALMHAQQGFGVAVSIFYPKLVARGHASCFRGRQTRHAPIVQRLFPQMELANISITYHDFVVKRDRNGSNILKMLI